MSVYNTERFLRHAMDSVLSQSFQDFEFITFEDKSSDESLEMLKSYKDTRVVLVENPVNQELTKNLGMGMGLARGSHVARMDADDVCLPHWLRT